MKRTKATRIVGVLAALALFLGMAGTLACSTTKDTPTERTFTDSAGRTVQLPVTIDNIAVSGSLAQMFVFPIGADKMVGLAGAFSAEASAYIDPKYTALPVLGQFFGSGDLNMEEITALGPQVIIDVGEEKATIADDMDTIQTTTGIPTVFIKANFDELDKTYTMLGELLGEQAKAKTLADYCRSRYDAISSGMAKVGDRKLSFLYVTGANGTNVIAEGSFHAQMINMMGKNAAVLDNAVSSGAGNEVSLEQILVWDPDVIIFAPNGFYSKAATDPVYSKLKAIQSGNYYEVPSLPYTWTGFPPSVNRLLGAIWLAETLYPDDFDFDLKAEAQNFYSLFYHATLSDEQFTQLTQNAVKAPQQ